MDKAKISILIKTETHDILKKIPLKNLLRRFV